MHDKTWMDTDTCQSRMELKGKPQIPRGSRQNRLLGILGSTLSPEIWKLERDVFLRERL